MSLTQPRATDRSPRNSLRPATPCLSPPWTPGTCPPAGLFLAPSPCWTSVLTPLGRLIQPNFYPVQNLQLPLLGNHSGLIFCFRQSYHTGQALCELRGRTRVTRSYLRGSCACRDSPQTPEPSRPAAGRPEMCSFRLKTVNLRGTIFIMEYFISFVKMNVMNLMNF